MTAQKDLTAREKLQRRKTHTEFEKFKELINDITQMEFSKLLTTAYTTTKTTHRLKDSRTEEAASEVELSEAVSQTSSQNQLDPSTLANNLLYRVQEVKANVSRLT